MNTERAHGGDPFWGVAQLTTPAFLRTAFGISYWYNKAKRGSLTRRLLGERTAFD